MVNSSILKLPILFFLTRKTTIIPRTLTINPILHKEEKKQNNFNFEKKPEIKNTEEKGEQISNLLKTNKIYNLDCFELFKQMKDKNLLVDAIITDPPYNLGFVDKENFVPSVLEKWNSNFDQLVWIRKAASLVKKGGSIIIFNNWRNLDKIGQELERNEFLVKDLIRWVKPNPLFKSITKEYTIDHELAIWAVKENDKWTFNFEKQLVNNLKNKRNPHLIPEYIGDVVVGGERIHPTQKNLQVIKDIVDLHTNFGDLILDPFMGSGTTAVACKELGRDYIGSEIDNDYFEKAETRLKGLDFRKDREYYLETEHRLDEDSLRTLIKETETYVKKLELEIVASKNVNPSNKNDDYGWSNKRLAGKEKVKDELEKMVQQWKIKLSEIVYGQSAKQKNSKK